VNPTTQRRGRALLPVILLLAAAAHGGDQTNVRGLGMARATTASSRGLDAVGINPANLAVPDDASVEFSLIPVGIGVGSDFLTYGLYNKFFTGVDSPTGRVARNLSAADKQELLDAFPGGIGRIAGGAEVRPVGLAIRFGRFATFALTATDRISASAAIPSSYAKFLLDGVTPGSSYDFGGAGGSASWTREYALSAGVTLPRLRLLDSWAAGVSVKVVHGFAYAALTRDNTWLRAGSDGVLDASIDMTGVSAHADFAGSPFPAPAGTGIGLDLGLTAEVNEVLRAGLSVTDIGSIAWNRNVQGITGGGSMHMDNPMDSSQRDSLEHAVTGNTAAGSPFTTSLPTMLRMGLQVEVDRIPWVRKFMFGELSAALDYTQPCADAPGYGKTGRVAAGLEYRPWNFLPLRTGVGFGGPDRFDFALGFGLKLWVLQLDVASDNVGWLLSHDSFSRGSLGVALTLKM